MRRKTDKRAADFRPLRIMFWIMVALLVLSASGCASALRVGVDHTSHPLAGWPVGHKGDEDTLTQVQAMLVWRKGLGYFEAGLGKSITNEGFYGPSLTGTMRAGLEVPLR